MLDDILNELGRRRNMRSFLLYVLLVRIYWLLLLVCLDTISLDTQVSCTSLLFDDSNARFINLSGLGGLQCAFLIAFKQLVPEHTVSFVRSPIKIRVKVDTSLEPC
jgi:hypothetical protein